MCDEVLLPALPSIQSELLPSHQRVFHLRAQEARRLRDVVSLLDALYDLAIRKGDGSGNFRPRALHLSIVDPCREVREGSERVKSVTSHVLAECEALCLLAGPGFHVRSLHCSRVCVLLSITLIFRKKCGILNEDRCMNLL